MKKRRKKISGVRRRKSTLNGNMGSVITNTIAVLGGAVAAGYLNKVIPATMNQKIVAGGKIALGIALPMLSKDGKTKNLLSGVGAGMIAVGGIDLLRDLKVLSGDYDLPTINGDEDFMGEDVLGEDILGMDIPTINGDDDYMGEDDYMNGDEDYMGEDDFMNGDDDDM